MKISVAAWGLLLIEVAVVLLTTFGIVTVTYHTRRQFAQLENARSEQRVLLEDWGKLLLEESAFSSPSRVERIAREQLGMILPSADSIRELDKK